MFKVLFDRGYPFSYDLLELADYYLGYQRLMDHWHEALPGRIIDVNYEKFDIAHGDTLTDPQHWDDEPFEAIVSNPPYSIRWDGDANPLLINDPRFAPAGVLAPKSKADLAFTMHMLSWLAVNGTAVIVQFPGVLYRGGAEQKIRRYLVDNNYVTEEQIAKLWGGNFLRVWAEAQKARTAR